MRHFATFCDTLGERRGPNIYSGVSNRVISCYGHGPYPPIVPKGAKRCFPRGRDRRAHLEPRPSGITEGSITLVPHTGFSASPVRVSGVAYNSGIARGAPAGRRG